MDEAEPGTGAETAGPLDGVRARVRGIYATALTRRLRQSGATVVQPSPAIRARFDADLPTAPRDVAVASSGDDLGVVCSGGPDPVAAVRSSLTGVARDALGWSLPAPLGAVHAATVERTLGGGAVVDLGPCEGYLPYDAAEDRVEAGDALRVQVRTPAAPWVDDRPVVGQGLQAPGGVATLVRGVDALVAGSPDGSPEHELVGLTELLDPDCPEGWGVRWERAAEDLEVATAGEALEAAVERARTIEAVLTEGSGADRAEATEAASDEAAPGVVAAPWASAAVRFGREARFALDDARRAVLPTMAGHHRVKAAGSTAGDAVDFAERLGAAVEAFPFDAVVGQFGPGEGERVTLAHGKPDGRDLSLGRATVTEVDLETETVTLRRELTAGGTYDGLGVPMEAGDVAVTKVREGRWWYPTVYRDADGEPKGTYCNVCTPLEVFPDAVRYVDLHVDVLRHADGTVAVVDEDELAAAVDDGDVPAPLAERAREVADRLADSLDGD